jgi:Tn3 transposase DDE domain
MDLVLSTMRGQGRDVREEGTARLSPLGYRHIHLLGRYNVALSEDVARGGFRALRQAIEPESGDDYSA